VEKIKLLYPDAEVIAGVATGAIAQGVLVAEALNLPFIYIRSAPKKHGTENLIEGKLEANQKVVVIEDLISTGGSSLQAVDALKKANAHVLGMLAIFTYGFPLAEENFKNQAVTLTTLTNYIKLLELAVETGYIRKEQLDILKQWRNNPDTWMQE
jgi:orotate phosphoribosyltransferase